jgi:hypothetical protein
MLSEPALHERRWRGPLYFGPGRDKAVNASGPEDTPPGHGPPCLMGKEEPKKEPGANDE